MSFTINGKCNSNKPTVQRDLLGSLLPGALFRYASRRADKSMVYMVVGEGPLINYYDDRALEDETAVICLNNGKAYPMRYDRQVVRLHGNLKTGDMKT